MTAGGIIVANKSVGEANHNKGQRRNMAETTFRPVPCSIKAIGVGGGGCNAINRMVRAEIHGAAFIAINTDAQALMSNEAPTRIQMGERESKGLGVGGDPERGERCARESLEDLREVATGANIVFITAGMGGGTGTGASPLIARLARESGALTIAIVTRPFDFELARRQQIADEGIRHLSAECDAMIVIQNERLLAITGQEATVDNAFKMADEVLMMAVRTITEVITVPGLINVDVADVKSILGNAGLCWLSIGRGSGQKRTTEAMRAAVSSNLIDVPINGATGVLYIVSGPPDLSLNEVGEAANVVQAAVNEEANVIFGVTFDARLGSDVTVTLIATGFTSAEELEAARRDEEFRDVIDGLETDESRLDSPAFARRPVSLRRLARKHTSEAADALDEHEELSKGLLEVVGETLESSAAPMESPDHVLPARAMKTSLDTLPVEIVLADSNDVVAYFNKETDARMFLRTRIGKRIHDGYPEESVHFVDEILEEFKSGRADTAEFEVDVRNRRFHICFLALHDSAGEYLGCVEISQQIAHPLELEEPKVIHSLDRGPWSREALWART